MYLLEFMEVDYGADLGVAWVQWSYGEECSSNLYLLSFNLPFPISQLFHPDVWDCFGAYLSGLGDSFMAACVCELTDLFSGEYFIG